MAHIVLTEEQTRALAGGAVDLRDASGRLVAVANPLDEDEAKALEMHRQRRADPNPAPGVPAAVVHARLLKLEEIRAREGGMTQERMLELLRRMRAGEEV